MPFRAQIELLEFNLKLNLTTNRLSNLEREAELRFRFSAEPGIPPEAVEQSLSVLELMDTELAHIEDNVKQCRGLINNIFKALGYDASVFRLLKPSDEPEQNEEG